MKISILGAGAMGSLVGAHLKKGGGEVYFVDVYEEHMKAVAMDGLQMELSQTDKVETVRVDGAVTDGSTIGICDMVITLMKCYDTATAIETNKALFGKDTIVLTLQNGVGGADILREYFDDDHVGFGMLKASATLYAPGKIFGSNRFPDSDNGVYFSPIKIDTPYKKVYIELEALFNAGGMPAECTEKAEEHIWDKLYTNCISNPLGGLLQLSNGHIASLEDGVLLRRELGREICAVANAKGIKLDAEAYLARTGVRRELVPGVKQSYTSMVLDVYKKRRTEIDFLNGAVCIEAKKYGIPTPHNETIWRLVRMLQETYDVRFVPREE